MSRYVWAIWLLFLGCTLGSGAAAQMSGRPAKPGDKPLPCDPISIIRRGEDLRVPTRIQLMGDRYFELGRAMAGISRTHEPLVALDGEGLIPAACGDSPGMFYVVPMVASAMQMRVAEAFDTVVFVIVTGSALVSLFGFGMLFRWSRGPTTIAFVVLLLLVCYTLRIGDFVFPQSAAAMALIPWALVAFSRTKSTLKSCLFAIAAGIVVGSANQLRDHSATGVLLLLLVLVLFSMRHSSRIKLFAAVLLLLGVAIPTYSMHQLVSRRDAFLRRTVPNFVVVSPQHLFWHTVYVGFGFIANPEVPSYNDTIAIDKVRSVAPNVTYMSAEYDQRLKPFVLDFIRRHWLLFAAILLLKLCVILKFVSIAANIGLFAALVRPKEVAVEVAFWLAICFNSLFAFVAVPHRAYLLGLTTCAALYGVVSMEFAMRSHVSSPVLEAEYSSLATRNWSEQDASHEAV